MNLNDVIQTAAVAVIVIGCVIWLALRLRGRRRRGDCSCCDSTACPLKADSAKADKSNKSGRSA